MPHSAEAMMTGDQKRAKPATASDKAQLDRFKQIARELGCDETGEAFERAFAKAVPVKKPAKKQTL